MIKLLLKQNPHRFRILLSKYMLHKHCGTKLNKFIHFVIKSFKPKFYHIIMNANHVQNYMTIDSTQYLGCYYIPLLEHKIRKPYIHNMILSGWGEGFTDSHTLTRIHNIYAVGYDMNNTIDDVNSCCLSCNLKIPFVSHCGIQCNNNWFCLHLNRM